MGHTLLLIRHAEKPDPPRGIVGLDAEGRGFDGGLSLRGWQRAGALAALFGGRGTAARDPRLVVPTALHAAASRAGSHRPVLTVQPLAAALGIPVSADCHSDRDEARLVQALDRATGPVLVCWRHDALPGLARRLAGDAPRDVWGDTCFDEVWVVADDGAGARRVTVVPQSLLAGDA